MKLLKTSSLYYLVLSAIISTTLVSTSLGRIQTNDQVSVESDETVVVVEPSVLVHIHLNGVLSEKTSDAVSLTGGQVSSLRSLVRLMDKASNDDKVQGIILTFDAMSLGFGQLEELRYSINGLKEAGKKVYVHAESMNTLVYGLLSAGSYLSVAPQSSIWLTGLYGESVYLKDLLDKVGIEADYLHMGDYKSAAEMLTLTGPSDEARENMNWLLDSYYETLVNMISQSRQLSVEQVERLIDNGPYLAKQALELDLIDAEETRFEFIENIKKDFNEPVRIENRYGIEKKSQININSPLALFSVLNELFNPPQEIKKDAIAVIYVEGTIMSGHSQPNLLGAVGGAFSGDIRKSIEVAANDDSIKAVVMRVDSPGGSAEASEVILNATRTLAAKKPFIVSMGDVAGSGGYYVSCAADTIFADEVTVTASIGVVGGKVVANGLWEMLGIDWVDYKRGENADILNINRNFSPEQRSWLEGYMQDIYDVFKNHVVENRGQKLTKPIDDIAGGRVYTGKQAKELGLIDEIGGFKQAIEYAAAKVSLDDYEVRVIPRSSDFITQLLEQYSGQGERPTDISIQSRENFLLAAPAYTMLFDVLQKTDPKRARILQQAIQRIELLRTEGVIMMMPFDMMIN